MTCGVYCLITKESGLRYIGSSLCIEVRIKTHFNLLKRGTHYNYKIQAAYNTEEVLFEIIEECQKINLMDREQFYIDFYKSSEIGLNIAKFVAGAFARGRCKSLITRKKNIDSNVSSL